ATSTSSVAIGTGSKSFTIQSGKSFAVGQLIYAIDAANPANWMKATVDSYSGTSLGVTVPSGGTHGSGTKTNWIIVLSALSQKGGREGIFVPAAAMTPRSTNGAAIHNSELSTS